MPWRIRVKSSRLWRECRGEACLARHVRRTRIADIAIIHFKTSFVGYRGRGVPRPYKALREQGYRKAMIYHLAHPNIGH